jgi:hypothetical protein
LKLADIPFRTSKARADETAQVEPASLWQSDGQAISFL